MTESSLFWIWSAILLMAVLVALIVPFLRRPRKALARAEYDLAIYKDQLRELEEDEASGLITGAEAEAARNEIARRILTADAARKKAEQELKAREGGTEKAVAMAAALILVPALAFGLYLEKGRPGMPDMPIAERMRLAAEHNDINALVKRVEDRLAKKPDDIQGWLVLAPVYARLGRYDKAVNAWKNAIRLSEKPDPDLYNSLGEALVYANRGRVVPEAKQAFEKALKLAPGNPMSRYFLAQAKLQGGRKDEALADLKGLLKDLPENFAGKPLIERQIARLEGNPPQSLPSGTSRETPSASTAGDGATGGPSPDKVRERMKRMADMSPEARQQMIRNMVEGLEQKLQDNPNDPGGWLRLIRAWSVLGEKDKARAALEKARKALAGNGEALDAIDRLAKKLSL